MEGTNQNVKENDEITIDLTELFMTLWSKAHIIILSGILLGLLVSMGSLHRQSGIRAAAGNRGVSSAFFSTLTLQRALQHV